MKVSVIIATYRRDEPLRRAIASVKNQTYPDIEIIVVDDNADPKWNTVVESMVNSFESITYIKNEKNCGSAKTRNIGIFAATGDYITFLDDDDEYLPEKIEKQFTDMLTSNADFGITDLFLYNENDQLIDKRIRSYIESTEIEKLMKYHIMYHITGTDTMMFKTSYLRKIGGFNGIDVGDEFYLMKEAILMKGSFVYSNHNYVKAYVHTGESGGLSSGQKKIDGENALYAEKQKYYSYLNKNEIRYVKARHFAVLAFAEYRRKKYGHFLKNAGLAFVASPSNFIRILNERKG